MEITLEMVDKVIERTGVSYLEAKEALEESNGNVLDAIIYLEEKYEDEEFMCKNFVKTEEIEDVKEFVKNLIKKGYATRIRILKDDEELCDIPVNAGISASVIALCIPPVLAFAVIAAVATKITIEITKEDGSIEVVNKYISKAVEDAKDKANQVAAKVKVKANEFKTGATNKTHYAPKVKKEDEQVFTYTVKFDEEK